MVPKYSAGAKVRIKAHNDVGRILDPKVQIYENMTGEVVDVKDIVAFIGEPWATAREANERIVIYHYTVRIDDQIVLHDVFEDCLEIIR
jgi:hypothetical protein